MDDRLRQLTDLEEKIRVELLGNGKHVRYDLLDLQKAVKEEIRKLTSGIMV